MRTHVVEVYMNSSEYAVTDTEQQYDLPALTYHYAAIRRILNGPVKLGVQPDAMNERAKQDGQAKAEEGSLIVRLQRKEAGRRSETRKCQNEVLPMRIPL